VFNFLLPGHGWTRRPAHEEGGAERSTRRQSLGKIPGYLREIQARGSQKQTPRRKCRARGQPQKIRAGAPKLARGANARAHEGRCHELGLQREGDVPSVAVIGPISLQFNVESRDAALGRKSGTLATWSSGSNGKERRKRQGEMG
jgi:hypothetical protein